MLAKHVDDGGHLADGCRVLLLDALLAQPPCDTRKQHCETALIHLLNPNALLILNPELKQGFNWHDSAQSLFV